MRTITIDRSARRLAELPDLLASLPHLSRDEADEFGRDLDDARRGSGPPPTPQ